MAVHVGSRYEQTPVLSINDSKRGPITVLSRRKIISLPQNADIVTHRVVQKETLDFLAFRYLGDASLWWVILDANPQFLLPWDIKEGDLLIIPTEETLGEMLNAV